MLASGVWVVGSLAGLPLLGSTFALVVWAWMLAGGGLLVRRPGLVVDALVILALAGGKWVLVDSLSRRMLPSWDALHYYPVFNPVTGVGLLVALSLGGV